MDIALTLTRAVPPAWDIVLSDIPAGFDAVSREILGDNGLETAVAISLFTDARDENPDDPGDRRGWWGDTFEEFGSRLWLLTREKTTPEVLDRAERYARQALQWLLDDGIASACTISAERTGLYSLALSVTIVRPSAGTDSFRFALNWAAMGA